MEGHYTCYKNIAYNKYRNKDAVSITKHAMSKIMIENNHSWINQSLIINREWRSGILDTKQEGVKSNHELHDTRRNHIPHVNYTAKMETRTNNKNVPCIITNDSDIHILLVNYRNQKI